MLTGRYDADTGIVTYFEPSEGPALRRTWIDTHVVPAFVDRIAEDPRVRSAVLTAIEGDRSDKPHLRDEVHLTLWFSVLDDARAWMGHRWDASRRRDEDDANAPADRTAWRRRHRFDADDVVPLFACCTHEGADRPRRYLDDRSRVPRPTVLGRLHRDRPTDFRWEGVAHRPWLDGLRAVHYDAERVFAAREGDERRRHYLHDVVRPQVERHFDTRPALRSCALAVAQYWDDGARDEVHLDVIVSAEHTPRLDEERFFVSDGTVPGVTEWSRDIWLTLEDTGDWVPLFAACCVGAATQDDDRARSHRVFAYFRRRADGHGVDVEIVGGVLRPWLDGLRLSPEAWT